MMKSRFFRIIFLTLLLTVSISILGSNVNKLKQHDTHVYIKAKSEYQEILLKKSPREALLKLREDIQKDKKLSSSCHSLVHELGHAAFLKYKDIGKALSFQDEICNSGYIHGVIESYFNSSKDIFETIQTVCKDYPPDKFITWQCHHGIGHGLMYYTDNNLPKSLELCNTLGGENASACINGVFMENFNVDQKIHTSKFLKEEDFLYPCNSSLVEKKNKSDCYVYAPSYYLSLHPTRYENALVSCQNAEESHRNVCFLGVGMQAMKENIENPLFVQDLCLKAPKGQVNSCMGGAIGLYINHFGGVSEAKELCKTLDKPFQEFCHNIVSSKESLF